MLCRSRKFKFNRFEWKHHPFCCCCRFFFISSSSCVLSAFYCISRYCRKVGCIFFSFIYFLLELWLLHFFFFCTTFICFSDLPIRFWFHVICRFTYFQSILWIVRNFRYIDCCLSICCVHTKRPFDTIPMSARLRGTKINICANFNETSLIMYFICFASHMLWNR